MNLTTPETRFDKLRNRRLPRDKQAAWFTEEYQKATKDTDYEYLVESMQPISDEYTEQTFAQGDRVRDQLKTNLPASYWVEFAYQGSVTSDTHIKVHSDIDLITIHSGFNTLDAGEPNLFPYSGDPLRELKTLRADCEAILTRKFPAADVDVSGGKAIAVSGGSLEREIDVVIANWWNTKYYTQTPVAVLRGVHIFDKSAGDRVKNMPFLHNRSINDKDLKTNSGLRKAIRFLKTLKYDAAPVLTISSYDIAAIAHAMPDSELNVSPGSYLELAQNVNGFLKRCIANDSLRNSLRVPNGMRQIFGGKGASLSGLVALQSEVAALLTRIAAEKNTTMVLLNEKISEFGFGEKLAPWTERRSRRVMALL